MIEFKPAQTILNYIYHNQEQIRRLIRTQTQSQVAYYLTKKNLVNDKISQSKLCHIMQYVNTKVEKSNLPWKLTLPEFEENETIVEYIVKHSKLVYKYRQIMKSVDTCEYLILHNKAEDTIRPDKLGDICYYIEEELRHEN